MSNIGRLSAKDIANYCAGDPILDGSLEDELRELEVQKCLNRTVPYQLCKLVMVIP